MYINFPDVLVPAEASVQTGYSKKKKERASTNAGYMQQIFQPAVNYNDPPRG